MTFFWSNFIPNPVLFELGWFKIYWYGLILAIAILVAYYLIRRGKTLAQQRDIDDLVLWLVLGGLFGARIYDAVVYWPVSSFNWLEFFSLWQRGLAIHGAILGGAVTLLAWCLVNRKSFGQLADPLVMVLPLAQAIGRWGNYFNQELFGAPTSWPWKIFIEPVNRPAEYLYSSYFHPLFLYESLADLALFIVLYFSGKKFLRVGVSLSIYLFGYGVIRFVMEFWRLDQVAIYGGLRWPQWLSLILMLGVLIYWLVQLLLPKFKKNV